MTRATFDHLVYVRLFEGCNMYCEHCFIPQNPKKMSAEMIGRIPEIVGGFARKGDRIELRWHGGEPTLLGIDHLRASIDSVNSTSGFQWSHSIQTNLIENVDGLLDLARTHLNNAIGVSWDPGIRHLRIGGKLSNRDYERRFWDNFAMTQAAGIETNMVITVTRVLINRFSHPVRLLDYLSERGIRRVHFERLTRTGTAREAWERIGVSNAEYDRWMRKLFLAYWMRRRIYEPPDIHVSPFDDLFARIKAARKELAVPDGHNCWTDGCDTRFHTIDANGYKSGCTALTAEMDNPCSQVVHFIPPGGIGELRQKRREIIGCKACEHQAYCSSGCPASIGIDSSAQCAGGRYMLSAIREVCNLIG